MWNTIRVPPPMQLPPPLWFFYARKAKYCVEYKHGVISWYQVNGKNEHTTTQHFWPSARICSFFLHRSHLASLSLLCLLSSVDSTVYRRYMQKPHPWEKQHHKTIFVCYHATASPLTFRRSSVQEGGCSDGILWYIHVCVHVYNTCNEFDCLMWSVQIMNTSFHNDQIDILIEKHASYRWEIMQYLNTQSALPLTCLMHKNKIAYTHALCFLINTCIHVYAVHVCSKLLSWH